MRITIVQGAFLPVPPLLGGAVEKVWFVLGKAFAGEGHDVTHISRRYNDLPFMEKIDGVRHRRVPGHSTPSSLIHLKLLDLLYSWRVRRHLPAADILVTNTFWLPILARDSRWGKLYIHVARFPKGQMRFYSQAARLQTVSSSIAEAIREEAPGLADRVKVIPYPVGRQSEDSILTHSPRKKQILYVGRVHPEKGVHLLVRAFSTASRALPGWRLIIVGPIEIGSGGGGPKYEKELKQPGMAANGQIEWAGPVFHPDRLAEYYREASLFVYPSVAERGETFGLSVLEAMANGCAPLVSDLACFRDFVEEEVTGFVFDHRREDMESVLADRLIALTKDPERLAVVGNAARRKAAEYSVGNIAARFLEDFSWLLRESSPGVSTLR